MFSTRPHVWRGMDLSSVIRAFLHDDEKFASPAPSKVSHCRAARSIPVRNAVVSRGGFIFLCPTVSQTWRRVYSDQVHGVHSCDTRLCPAKCELCKRLCGEPHLHGLNPRTHHLCGSVPYPFRNVLVTYLEHGNAQRTARMLSPMLGSGNLST